MAIIEARLDFIWLYCGVSLVLLYPEIIHALFSQPAGCGSDY